MRETFWSVRSARVSEHAQFFFRLSLLVKSLIQYWLVKHSLFPSQFLQKTTNLPSFASCKLDFNSLSSKKWQTDSLRLSISSKYCMLDSLGWRLEPPLSAIRLTRVAWRWRGETNLSFSPPSLVMIHILFIHSTVWLGPCGTFCVPGPPCDYTHARFWHSSTPATITIHTSC